MPFLGTTTLESVCTSLRSQGTLPETGLGLISSLIENRTGKRRLFDPSRRTRWPTGRRAATSTVHGDGKPADEHRSPCTRTLKYLEGLTYVQAVLWVGSRLASGLAHAHERSILHLDLKPANILLTDDGQPMLLDFNLSIDLKNRPRTPGVGGTARYMSPEQLEAYRGLTREIDGRSDLYSLGIILFELLTGRRPAAGGEGSGVGPDRSAHRGSQGAAAPTPPLEPGGQPRRWKRSSAAASNRTRPGVTRAATSSRRTSSAT